MFDARAQVSRAVSQPLCYSLWQIFEEMYAYKRNRQSTETSHPAASFLPPSPCCSGEPQPAAPRPLPALSVPLNVSSFTLPCPPPPLKGPPGMPTVLCNTHSGRFGLRPLMKFPAGTALLNEPVSLPSVPLGSYLGSQRRPQGL